MRKIFNTNTSALFTKKFSLIGNKNNNQILFCNKFLMNKNFCSKDNNNEEEGNNNTINIESNDTAGNLNSNKMRTSLFNLKKDDIFTISLIGRPNVGKSTLFNRLAGESLALVDSTPGLTRDRKETFVKLFNIKLRLVDTAGIDDFEEKSSYEDLINKTISQSRQALVYSDLAFFIIDARVGVTHTDIKLAKWLNKVRERNNNPVKEDSTNAEDSSMSSKDFYSKLKTMKEEDEIKIPKLVLVANKAEDNFMPTELFSEYAQLKLGDPVLISAQHGDNLHEIYNIIEQNIPETTIDDYNEKIKKRYLRYLEYRAKLRQDFLNNLEKLPKAEKDKFSVDDWEKDFDYLNKFDLEDNSDYDSDNDIDPLDTLIEVPKDATLRKNMKKSSDDKETENEDIRTKINLNRVNQLKNFKRPIKIAVVGKQNVGKSSIVNSLLKDNRVIISEVPGTTRDSIPIQWVYKGRRIILIDTAGLKPKNSVHDKIEKLASASTIKAINYSHVVVYVIDSMEAFTPMDMKLIEYIGEQGRSLIVISNKWDLVSNGYKTKAKKWMEDQLEKGCSQYKLIKINFVSAKNFFKVDNIMDDVLNAYTSWNARISTNLLNQWINEIKKLNSAPNKNGEYLKLKFVTQIKTRPPAFTVFVNNINIFFKFHEAYLKKMMTKEFNLKNAPIRFLLRDHKKISENNKFKTVSISTAKIQKKLDLIKKKMAKPTYRRKAAGYENLYGKKSVYRQMRK